VGAADAAAAAAPGPRRIHPLPAGLLAGAVLTGGAILQQAGMVSTTAGKAGFVTGLYVVLVPLAGLFWGQRAGWPRWVGMVLAATGLYLLSVTRQFNIERGDLLVLASTLFWTCHVLLLAWLSPRTDAIALAFVQNAVCALLSGAVLPLVEHPSLGAIRAAAVPILYGGLLSVGVGFTLQILGQRRAPPAHAALLLSMEAVFAALGGWWLLGERLGARGLAGCALMFGGMLFAQLPLLLRLRPGAGRTARA
jgi:drug/metabolite transporter (DMT)-like permease